MTAPARAVYADYENTFSAAGINQTRHTVSVKITVSSGVYLPGYSAETTIETHIIIAETVIVGDVPDAFTKIDRLTDDVTEDEIDDIYDFGAENR